MSATWQEGQREAFGALWCSPAVTMLMRDGQEPVELAELAYAAGARWATTELRPYFERIYELTQNASGQHETGRALSAIITEARAALAEMEEVRS
jgi:hypothetical protein